MKALDTAKAVDEDTWQAEAERETPPSSLAAAIAAATALMVDMGVTPPPGYTIARMAADSVAQTVTEVVSMIGRAAANQARRLSAEINRLDQSDVDLDAITDAIRDRASRLGSWCRTVATQVATAAINGARDDGAVEANRDDNIEIERTWFSRRDDKVRHSHHRADGQVRGLDEPFIVGSSLLMRPGDPTAPVHETANCRCRLKHRSKRTGRWVTEPAVKALPRDADGDGMVFDGTPMQRPAPPRLTVVPDVPVARPTPAATPAAPASAAPTSMTDDLIAAGAARVAKYRAKAREWQGSGSRRRTPGSCRGTERMRRLQGDAGADPDDVADRGRGPRPRVRHVRERVEHPHRPQRRSEPTVEVFPDMARVTGNITDDDTGEVIGAYKRLVRHLRLQRHAGACRRPRRTPDRARRAGRGHRQRVQRARHGVLPRARHRAHHDEGGRH